MNSSELVKALRSYLGFSQMELAEQLGVTFATVNLWENGHSKPAPSALQKLKELCLQCNLQITEDNGKYQINPIKEDKAYFEREAERISKKKALELFDKTEELSEQ